MTVADLRRRMGAGEFLDWQEFMRREPIGPMRQDILHAIAMAHHANLHRSAKTPAYAVADFMPPWARLPPAEAPESSPEEFARALGALS